MTTIANAIVRLNFTLNLPPAKVQQIIGREDDGSQDFYEYAEDRVRGWVADNSQDALEYVHDEPDVDVTM